MKYISTLLVVKDMEKSKKFYCSVLELEVIADFGANVTLTGGISMQTLDTWISFIHNVNIIFENNAMELYFEEDNLDNYIEKLKIFDIEYVHSLKEHDWGQRAIRFYDPDKHIIEVGENIVMVVKRFINSGLSVEETAIRMDVSVNYIKSCLE